MFMNNNMQSSDMSKIAEERICKIHVLGLCEVRLNSSLKEWIILVNRCSL
jgi:hypothetical protein